MSRTCRQFFLRSVSAYRPLTWGPIRLQERLGIQRETRSADYGDAVFPHSRSVPKKWCGTPGRCYLSLKKVREDIFLDIRNILNGYTGRSGNRGRCFDFEDAFLEDFNRIKNGEKVYEPYPALYFNWLKNKEVKKAIKGWQDDPLDVLCFLTHQRFIEKAIVREHHKRLGTK